MVRVLTLTFFAAIFCLFAPAQAADHSVYTDGLQNSWENWSWADTSSSATPVHNGSTSLAVTADAWEAAYFHNSSVDASLYTNLVFWIHGGAAGGQRLLVQGISNGEPREFVELPNLSANTWQQITVSLSQLGVTADPDFDGFWIQDRSGGTQPTFYLDDITLVAGRNPGTPTNSATTVITIDAGKSRRPISDLIYGVAFASSNQLQQLNVPLNRSGGNPESRYNWQLNAHNRGFDWFFESLGDSSATPGAEADNFLAASRNGGAQPMLTIPMIGWVANLGPGRSRLASFSIAKYGAQTDSDWQWFPDAGNGISSATGQPITNNDPADANVLADSIFQQNWVRHLTNRWGTSAAGGLRYYIMDNEPSIWHSTHRDVVKTGLRMAELRDRFIDHASKVRAVDPGAIIVGPEEWGWSGYFYSGYDQQWGSRNGWGNLPDRAASGGMDYLPWFLDQMRRHEESTGQRLLDVFTVHYYPQSNEYSSDVSSTLQQQRNRSTRSLWDPNYVDQSWIGERVRLIPRLKEWVNQYYPGLKIGITEYSWGVDNHINGATAQAEILGIFGRAGLDLANRWVVPDPATPTFKAIQMYRNYDGAKSTFGDTSVSASVATTIANQDNLSAFASIRTTDRALTVMVINKVATTAPISISLTNFTPRSTAKLWQLTSANQITHLPDLVISGSTLTNIVPAQSISLFVLDPADVAAPRINRFERQSGDNLLLELSGEPNASYEIQSSTNLSTWTPLHTVTLTAPTQSTTVTAAGARLFFRAVSQ